MLNRRHNKYDLKRKKRDDWQSDHYVIKKPLGVQKVGKIQTIVSEKEYDQFLEKHKLLFKRKVYGKSAIEHVKRKKKKSAKGKRSKIEQKDHVLSSENVYHYEVAEEIKTQLKELYEKYEPAEIHETIVRKIIFNKASSKKKMMSILYAEKQMFSNNASPIHKLVRCIEIREKCFFEIMSLEQKFTDPKYYKDRSPLLNKAGEILSQLRSLTLEFVNSYILWKQYLKYLWMIECDKNKKDLKESHSPAGDVSFLEDKMRSLDEGDLTLKLDNDYFEKDVYFEWEDQNYFEKLLEDSVTLSQSKWGQFFQLRPMDIFLFQASTQSMAKRKRTIELKQSDRKKIDEL